MLVSLKDLICSYSAGLNAFNFFSASFRCSCEDCNAREAFCSGRIFLFFSPSFELPMKYIQYFGSWFRRAKMTHKSRKKLEISCFEVLDVLFWGREGFFCSFCVLYGGLGIGIGDCNYWSKNIWIFVIFLKFLVQLKPWIRIGSGSVFSPIFWIRIKWIRIRTLVTIHVYNRIDPEASMKETQYSQVAIFVYLSIIDTIICSSLA